MIYKLWKFFVKINWIRLANALALSHNAAIETLVGGYEGAGLIPSIHKLQTPSKITSFCRGLFESSYLAGWIHDYDAEVNNPDCFNFKI